MSHFPLLKIYPQNRVDCIDGRVIRLRQLEFLLQEVRPDIMYKTVVKYFCCSNVYAIPLRDNYMLIDKMQVSCR